MQSVRLGLVEVMDQAEALTDAELHILAAFVTQLLEERAKDNRVLANSAKSDRQLLAELELRLLATPITTVFLDKR